ncbi:hypothetical protein [Bradyrhizobium sp. CER78]|uniref:hypothetical protein n=1 Tax=Bradyrhizobium sp. CER78 TaxID=3039162 RepID=UPI00244C9474|nr:hypothetical protein [Bradyrhizobium sp. CER78]MDH2381283.1 hypothetical protein [Bradyrhizobium sp. CER78]
MPLHRDIHWLGKQWAVTGHGLQLINQKQMGYYDIEAARLWEARVSEVQSKAWIDRPDFDKALEIARGKFAQLAPDDLPPPTTIVAPLPPVRAAPPAAPRAPLDAASVPSIEELLARLKSKSVTPPPAAEAPTPRPPSPELPKLETPKLEPRKVESIRPELPKSEPPKAAKPEPRQSAPVTSEPPRPEARTVESPKAEPAKETTKAEPAQREAPKPEPRKPEPVRSEALKSQALDDGRQAAPAKKLEVPPLVPVVKVVRRPAWPVFARKIAGSGKFLQPWRVTSARWRGPSSGLPPRP